MEPTAHKPSVPTAAIKPANGVPPAKPATPAALTPPDARSRRRIVTVASVGVIVGTLTVVMLYFAPPPPTAQTAQAKSPAKGAASTAPADGNGGDGEVTNAPSADRAVPARAATPAPGGSRFGPPAAAPALMNEPVTPKWTGGLQNAWSKHPSAAYELIAENQVALLAKRVRPVLTVRCEAGRTEVFVLTESAAVIEGDDGKHTVRVGFDAGSDLTQRWMASADYDALFAPDAVRLAQQIANARTMRFAFTPYGAVPAVARFDVGGFDTLIGTIAKACRWK